MIHNVSQIFDEELDKIKDKIIYALDLTLGNGNDVNRILDKARKLKEIYAFDIQDIAIKNSRDNIKDNKRVTLINDSHENVRNYVDEKIDFAVMNLGYLPGGDKSITTKTNSTLKAIENTLDILNSSGKFIITVYPGHPEGERELKALIDYLKELDQKTYTCRHIYFLNQINNPPQVFIIEKY